MRTKGRIMFPFRLPSHCPNGVERALRLAVVAALLGNAYILVSAMTLLISVRLPAAHGLVVGPGRLFVAMSVVTLPAAVTYSTACNGRWKSCISR